MPLTFINLLINLRKLGQISSPFCILYDCAKVNDIEHHWRRCDKEANNVNGIISTHLAAALRST